MTNGKRARLRTNLLKFHRSRVEPADPEGQAARNERRKALALSWLENPITDIIVRDGDYAIANGNERISGLLLLGHGEKEIDVSLLPADTPDAELDAISMLDDYFKTRLTQYERACLAQKLKETLGVSNKELAGRMRINQGYLSKHLVLFECHPEVVKAAAAGRIGVNDWWFIAKARRDDEEQLRRLKKRLAGTREQMQRAAEAAEQQRQQAEDTKNGKPKERVQRIRIPLAIKTEDMAVSGTATVAGLPGQDISLIDAENILREALRAVREGQKRKLDIKTFQAMMRDMAAGAEPEAAGHQLASVS